MESHSRPPCRMRPLNDFYEKWRNFEKAIEDSRTTNDLEAERGHTHMYK